MAYVDYEYYKEDYKGTLDEEVAGKLLDEASDQVDRLTYGRIRKRGFNSLTEYQQTSVKKAICYQVDFLSSYSQYLNMPIKAFSAGDVNLSLDDSNKGGGGVVADKRTLDYLNQTGLTSRRL